MFACHGDPSHDTVSTCNSYATLPGSHKYDPRRWRSYQLHHVSFGVKIQRCNFCFFLRFFIFTINVPSKREPRSQISNTHFLLFHASQTGGLVSPGIDGTRNHRRNLMCFPWPGVLKPGCMSESPGDILKNSVPRPPSYQWNQNI